MVALQTTSDRKAQVNSKRSRAFPKMEELAMSADPVQWEPIAVTASRLGMTQGALRHVAADLAKRGLAKLVKGRGKPSWHFQSDLSGPFKRLRDGRRSHRRCEAADNAIVHNRIDTAGVRIVIDMQSAKRMVIEVVPIRSGNHK